jgi:hypothetical protein
MRVGEVYSPQIKLSSLQIQPVNTRAHLSFQQPVILLEKQEVFIWKAEGIVRFPGNSQTCTKTEMRPK